MRRFFAPEITVPDLKLTGNEAKHISRVLRMREGDMLVLFDGTGYDYTAEIVGMKEESIVLKVQDKVLSDSEPKICVKIYQAVIKSDHFDFVVQKCTELGVFEIIPFISERCVKIPRSPQAFVEREARIALEAAKQCGRSGVPVVNEIVNIEAVEQKIRTEFAILAYEGEKKQGLKEVLAGFEGDRLSVIIGPEGGFTKQEVERLAQAGAVPVSLGKLILRAETAGAAALAMLRYEFDE